MPFALLVLARGAWVAGVFRLLRPVIQGAVASRRRVELGLLLVLSRSRTTDFATIPVELPT